MLNNKESTKIGSDVALLLASMVLPWAVWILADKADDELVRLIATWLRTGLWFILWGFCVLVQVRWILDRHTILKARDHVLCTWLNISHVWAYARFGFCVLTPLAWLTYKPAWYWLVRNDVLWPAPEHKLWFAAHRAVCNEGLSYMQNMQSLLKEMQIEKEMRLA